MRRLSFRLFLLLRSFFRLSGLCQFFFVAELIGGAGGTVKVHAHFPSSVAFNYIAAAFRAYLAGGQTAGGKITFRIAGAAVEFASAVFAGALYQLCPALGTGHLDLILRHRAGVFALRIAGAGKELAVS